MTTPAETFQKASFNGIPFPIVRVSVRGGLRHYLHEFPHSPGAEVEKMGRKAYAITMTAFFHSLPNSRLDEEYPNLYPEKLFSLQKACEDERTGPLVIPNIGTMQAVAIDWRRTFDFSSALSGEAVEFEFVEDQDRDLIFENAELGRGSLEKKNYQLQALVGGIHPVDPPSIFQAINDAVTAVLAVQGVGDAMLKVLEAKLLEVANLCQTADRIVELQPPENFALLNAMKEVWLAANDLAEDLLVRGSPIETYTVRRMMSVSQAAAQIFGSSEKAIELLQMNPIEDAFAIPEGTVLRYYRAA